MDRKLLKRMLFFLGIVALVMGLQSSAEIANGITVVAHGVMSPDGIKLSGTGWTQATSSVGTSFVSNRYDILLLGDGFHDPLKTPTCMVQYADSANHNTFDTLSYYYFIHSNYDSTDQSWHLIIYSYYVNCDVTRVNCSQGPHLTSFKFICVQ
jgi:hypothetical protein